MNYSVLMSVYYKENPTFLRNAMKSMWNQTTPTNDFVLVCDGPLTNELDAVIDEMKLKHLDSLSVIRLEKNVGLGNALNKGLRECKNELVARMDSDDISISKRCEKQMTCFANNTELSICSGTILEFRGTIDDIVGKRELPESNEKIIEFSRKRNPFNHPAVMFKKSAVLDAGGYNEKYHLFEDYYLWVRMLMKGYKGYNISEPILYMRTPEDLYMRRGGRKYAKDMLSFHRWMKSIGWINIGTFLTGAVPHALVCILPNTLRGQIYKTLHA